MNTGSLTMGGKCVGHTVTGSVLTTVTYRPNSPVTRSDPTRGNQYNSIQYSKIITSSQVSYQLSYMERYITAQTYPCIALALHKKLKHISQNCILSGSIRFSGHKCLCTKEP